MKSLRSLRSMMLLPTFALVAAVAACSGAGAADGNGTTATPVTAQAKDHGPGRHMGPGPEMLLFSALHEEINLTDAQRSTIEGLVEGLRPKGPPPGFAANKTALVAGIRAGKIDVAALTPAKPDMTEHRAAVAKALSTLHSTLTSEQRVALVAAIKKHAEDHKFGFGPKGDGPKGDGPKGDGPKADIAKGDGKMHPGHHFGGPMHIVQDLDLTEAQKTAIHAEFDKNKPAPPSDADKVEWKKKHEAMRAEMGARLDKFAAPTFDATAFVTPPADAPAFGGPGEHFLKELAVIVPILTPAQREKLAEKIEKGPTK